MKRLPIADPDTGEVMPGEAFQTSQGRLAFHPCHNDACPGIVIGLGFTNTAAVLHFTAADALVIGQSLVDLAKKALG